MRRSCPNVILNGLIPAIVFLLAIVPLCSAQYLWRDADLQRPNENHVIDRVFSGNTPFLGWRIYDDQEETTALTNWTWKFYYSMDRDDLEGGWELTGTTDGNEVVFDGGTNVFFRPYDRYYFSLRATSPTDQVRTVANGRMIQEHDPAAGDHVAGTWVQKFTFPDEDGLLYGIRDKEWAVITAASASLLTFNGTEYEGSIALHTNDFEITAGPTIRAAQVLRDGATAGGTALQPAGDGSGLTGITAAQVGASPTGHAHIIGDVTGLQAELDGKAGTGTVATLQAYVDTNVWDTAQIPALDYVPLTRQIVINNETNDLSADREWTIDTGVMTETDPIFTNWFAGADYTTVSNAALTAFGWGDHGDAGYLEDGSTATAAERIQVDDDSWMTMVDGDGTIYRIEQGTGDNPDTNIVVITDASVDYNGPAVGAEYYFDGGGSTATYYQWTNETEYVVWSQDPFTDVFLDNMGPMLDIVWTGSMPLPSELTAVEVTDATGTVTIDYWRPTTNTYTLAIDSADSTPYTIIRADGTATVSRVNGNSQAIHGTNTFDLAIEPGDAATASIIYLAIEYASAMSSYQTNNITWSSEPTATNGMFSIVLESDMFRTNWYGSVEERP